MNMHLSTRFLAVAILLMALSRSEANEALRKALTFHASFDSGLEADFALGEKRLFNAPAMNKRADAKPGLPSSGEVVVATGHGRFGNGLRFVKKSLPWCSLRQKRTSRMQRPIGTALSHFG
jgi:hypothetical protein